MPARPPAPPPPAPDARRPAPRRDGRRVVDVTVVLVAHDGAAWLPEVLAALRGQTVRPARVLCVDTGSRDGSGALLAASGLAAGTDVLTLPVDTGFGAAVAAALMAAERDDRRPPDRWLWLLHDDSAPAPDALERLLEHAATATDAAALGPKAVDWHDPRVLVEVGLTTDRAGHRQTGLERREHDQGQHDAPRGVLAVGTAAALVRRDVWDALGGLDPALPVHRDDLDLGWRVNAAGHRVVVVPRAQVRHVRAAMTGRRRVDAVRGRPGGVDRRHALTVLLAHCSGPRLPLRLARLVLACVLRAVGFLLSRQPREAGDEVLALLAVLAAPRRLHRARRARRATRTVPPGALKPLLGTSGRRWRGRVAAVGDWVTGGSSPGSSPFVDAGPGSPADVDELEPPPGRALRRLLLRPPVLLGLGLALLALLAERAVLAPVGGLLAGGRLLPAPDGATELWASYLASWHPAAVGSAAPAPPSIAVLAALSTLLLGKAWLAVDLLLLASVPLAGLTAWYAAGRVVTSPLLRGWAAATWALLPVATGAVATGRLDAAVVQVALPLLLVGARAVVLEDPRERGWRRAWALGLGLSLVVSLAPPLWPGAALLLLAAAGAGVVSSDRALRRSTRRRVTAAAIVAVTPLLVLLPWSLHALRTPGLLLHGPGRLAVDPALTDPALPAWQLPLLAPGGAGLPPAWIALGLLAAALGALVRGHRRGLVTAAWTGALVALGTALVLSRLPVPVPGAGLSLPVWPGAPLQVAGAGLLIAALVAADGLTTRLAQTDFGWRQVVAGLTALAAAAVPVLAAGAWVLRGADDPLRRDLPALLPAFARAELEAEPGLRVLALRPGPGEAVSYELTGARGDRLGRADVPPDRAQLARLDEVVADLLTPRGSDAAEALSTRAVRYVALPGPVADTAEGSRVAGALDAQAGLARRAAGDVLLWQVVAPTGRLAVLPAETAAAATAGEARGPDRDLLRSAPPELLPAGREAARTQLPPGEVGRLLVLSEAVDPGWRARLDGRPLEAATAWGWAQAFVLPADGGRLELRRDPATRRAALALQALAVLVVAVLAAPAARRRRGLVTADEVEPAPHEPTPHEPASDASSPGRAASW